MYECKQCGSPVLVLPNIEPIRQCSCKKENGTPSTIVASIKVTIEGKGKLN